MWVNKEMFDMILNDNRQHAVDIGRANNAVAAMSARARELCSQKAKDDITIDWMRHRINALEKQNSIMVSKLAGVAFPVPEIVPSRPGTMSELPASMSHLPSFEDVGDDEAKRLGVSHLEDGSVEYTK